MEETTKMFQVSEELMVDALGVFSADYAVKKLVEVLLAEQAKFYTRHTELFVRARKEAIAQGIDANEKDMVFNHETKKFGVRQKRLS